MGIAGFYVVRNFLGSKEKLFSLFNFIGILITILPVCFLYQEKYSSLILLLTYLIYIFVYKRIFKLSFSVAVVVSSFFIVLLTIVDLTLFSIASALFPYSFLRTSTLFSIASNILIAGLTILVSYIPFIRKQVRKLCEKIDDKDSLNLIIFLLLLIVVISLLYYNVTTVFQLNLYYTVTLISIAVFILLSYFYISEKNKYQKLNDEYNTLFDYVQNFENWIDDEQMYRHELNNNLGMLRDMVENEEAINKIDDMLKVGNIVDEEYIEDLKNVPKGGLKGLLYYKIAIAKNAGVQMIVDVSPLVTEKIEKLSKRQIRSLGIVLGIYLDNAIEAAKETKKGQVTLEIYSLNQEINFVISNTYKGVIRVEDINKKGYSTKGKGHGKGLYYAMKTINKEKYLSTEQSVLNNFFIQRLVVN